MNILIAPDSFKGHLTAMEAAECIQRGMGEVLKQACFKKLPMADGGEGTVQALVEARGGEIIEIEVHGPLGRKVNSYFGLLGDHNTAIIEMAAASGLALLEKDEQNPLNTTTYGTGELITAALDEKVEEVIIGIGGSATVDAGVGMAQALGAKFKDSEGKELGFGGGELKKLDSIDITGIDSRINNIRFVVACDVSNTLTGEKGAARVYGPQKGADSSMVEELEKGLVNFANVVEDEYNVNIANVEGTGAAGGLGAGLVVFCNSSLKPGIDIVTETVHLEEQVENSDIIITGEGQIDYQTVSGKALSGIGEIAKKYGKPVVAINGTIGENAQLVHEVGIDAYFSTVSSLHCNVEKEASVMLKECSKQVAKVIEICKDKLIPDSK